MLAWFRALTNFVSRQVTSLRWDYREAVKIKIYVSLLHANAGVNATDLTETALRTADAWNPTGLSARLGLCFCAKGMNG